MIIRSTKPSIFQVIMSFLVVIILWITTPNFIDAENLILVRGIGFLVVFYFTEFLFFIINANFLGEKIAEVTKEYIQVNNQKIKWEKIIRWNVSCKTDSSAVLILYLLNIILGIRERTVYIQTNSTSIVINDAPLKLIHQFKKYTKVRDKGFVVKQPLNKIT